MKMISRKKQAYPLSLKMREYLGEMNRIYRLPIDYRDLLRFTNSVPLTDKEGRDTLWISVNYPPHEQDELSEGLLQIYAMLRAEGDQSAMEHLQVDRIDLCLYGNSRPFRVRIVNTLNENFDYFYVKYADASRIFGLELEHTLSPNRIEFLTCDQTLIEEHILGIPGDIFAERHLQSSTHNKVRIAKEFVKFNERSFLKLLGDMHSANFVVHITLDLEENTYRLRAIDFDQQCYEPRMRTYQPQFFSENRAYVEIVAKYLSPESIRQYQVEERSLIHKRMQSSQFRFHRLMEAFQGEMLAPPNHIRQLAEELSKHYQRPLVKKCSTMPELVRFCLQSLEWSNQNSDL